MSTAEANALQDRINRGIPLSAAMGYRISVLDDNSIVVQAPLAPNINVHGTGFAGSLYALGILTAWGLCTHLINRAGLAADLVVAEAQIRYLSPVHGEIRCRCMVDDAVAKAFIQRLRDKRRSRLRLQVGIDEGPAAKIDAMMHASIT